MLARPDLPHGLRGASDERVKPDAVAGLALVLGGRAGGGTDGRSDAVKLFRCHHPWTCRAVSSRVAHGQLYEGGGGRSRHTSDEDEDGCLESRMVGVGVLHGLGSLHGPLG